MKRIISLIIVFVLVAIPCCFMSAGATIDDDISIVVTQVNSSYAGWSNTSPTYYGSLYSGKSVYPISLVGIRTQLSTMVDAIVNPTTVDVIVSIPNMPLTGVVYLSLWNGYGQFVGGENPDILFDWDSTIPGYKPRYSVGSSMGYTNGGSLSVSTPSNFVVQAGVVNNNGSTGPLSSATVVSSISISNTVPNSNGTGSTLVQPYYKSSNTYRLVRYNVNNTSNGSGVIFRYDANDLSKCEIVSGNSNQYLHSAIFIPCAIFVPVENNSIIGKLDVIATHLSAIRNYESDIALNMDTLLSYMSSGNTTVISALADILSCVDDIEDQLSAVTGNQYASAIQYIEYYLSQVLSNTDIMVNQLNDITATLNNIANTIGAANTQAQTIDQNVDSVETYETDIFNQANIDIGSTVISSFTFDNNTASGLARAGLDFTSLWSAIRDWHNIYIFSMLLTLAFTIIRFNSARARSKQQAEDRQARMDYYNSRKGK